ncbi:MAG: hypothetical protein ACRCS9_10940 [Hyphomicrobium sp.]
MFSQRERLGHGKTLTLRQMLPLIANQGKLLDAVERMHGRERRHLAQMQKVEQKGYAEKIWEHHERRFDKLIEQQATERATERAHNYQLTRSVTFQDAKVPLLSDVAAQTPAPEPELRRISQAPAPAIEQDSNPVAPAPVIVIVVPKPEVSTDRKAPDISGAFGAAASQTGATSRVADIKREMEAWRKQNDGRDFGRER